MRVMHLIEPWDRVRNPAGCDAGVLACRAMIDATPEIAHEPIIIGPRSARIRALQLGVSTSDAIAPAGPAHRVWRHLRSLALVRGCPDVIQVWSASAHQLAIRAAIAPVVTPDQVVDMLPLPALPTPHPHDPDLEHWHVDGTLPIIAALADPPGGVDAVRFVLLLGLLEQIGIRVAGLIESSAVELARACVFAERIALHQPLIITDRPVLTQLASVDLGVWIPRPAATPPLWAPDLVVDTCHSAAVPVVGPRGGAGEPTHQPMLGALDAATGDARSLLGVLARVLQTPGRLDELAEAARASTTAHADDVHGLRVVLARAVRGLGVGDHG